MFDVYLLNYSKNHRSTSQPTISSSSTPTQCKLKSPSSILKPVLELGINPDSQAAWASANYAYIPDFNRYYYITNTTLNGNIVLLSLVVDHLASWKTAITGSSQYVLRSASNYNGTIRDSRYPIRAVNPDRSGTYGTQIPNPLQPGGTNTLGCFVVGIIQKGSPFGTVSYYAMSQLVFLDFMLKLFNLPTFWQDGADLADGLKKAITDPMQYVVSAIWYPYSVNDFVNRNLVTATYDITVGYDTFTLGAVAYAFNTMLNIEFTNLLTLSLPDHPQAAARGSYMNFEPFSRYYLSFYPFCNLVELDSTQVGGKGTVYCLYTVDLRTGKGICSVCTEFNGSSYADWTPRSPIRVFEAQVGVPIPVATIHTEIPSLGEYLTNLAVAGADYFGGFNQIGKVMAASIEETTGVSNIPPEGTSAYKAYQRAVAEAKTGTPVEPVQMGDMSKIASNAFAMKSTCESLGTQGTMSMFSRMPVACWGNFFYAADDNVAKYGRPCCSYLTLSTLSGFVQCDQPYITGAGMSLQEQLDIERDLSEGIYLL